MNNTTSDHPARTAAEHTLDTLKYFLEAALDDARMVLRTAQAIVRDREHSEPTETAAAGKPKQPAARSRRGTPLTEAQVRDIRKRYQPDETANALAQEYGRSLDTIRTIAYRGTWRHLPPEPGEYRQPDPATSGKTAPSKTPPPATPGETAPRPATTPPPKENESAAPAGAATNTGAGTATTAARTPAAEPPKKTAPARRAGIQARGKGRITTPKLTETQVREIRRAYRPGGKTRALAKKYGVSPSNILNIAQRRSWNHLEPGPGEYMPPPADGDEPAATPAEPPPSPRRHATARTATAAAKAGPTAAPKPNGGGRKTPQAGSGNGAAARIHTEKQRLNPDSIRSIRERAADNVPPRRIARDFGISEETVRSLSG